MATKLKDVDVVVVGLGWTGGILSKELTEAGMKVVALERGNHFNPANDFAIPNLRDELRYVQRLDQIQDPAMETLSFRHRPSEEALPMRRMGSFLPGNGVGGAANVTIALVVHGPALKGFQLATASPESIKRIADFSRLGLQLAACGNTMKAQEVTLKDLIPGFVVAEAGGVVRIAELQSQGYVYLRP